MNIKQIAKAAGVSVATVSRVLNHPESVAPKTREKIQKIIDAFRLFTEGSAGQLDRAAMFLWVFPPLANRICYNIARQFNRCAFVALQARVKPGKLYGEPRWGECVR